MTELRVSHLIDEADELLDNKLHVGSYCLFMNTDEIQDILSKIRAILPEEIKAAEMILKRRDDIFTEAQSRAERIINEAQNTAANILSESELVRAVREKAAKIQEQVKDNCDEMRAKAEAEAEEIKKTAYREALQMRESVQTRAEELLNTIARDVDQVQKIIKNGQDYIAQQKNTPKSVVKQSLKLEAKEKALSEQRR